MTENRSSGLQKMLAHQASGKKIIVAGKENIVIGSQAMAPGGFKVRIVRRASRQEFIDNAPDEDRQKAVVHTAPFYFEIEPVVKPS